MKRVIAYVLFFVLVLNLMYVTPVQAEVVTEESWTDPGNYTKGWYDETNDCDIYANKGTQEDPFEIHSEKDLAALSYYADIATKGFEERYIKVTVSELNLDKHFWHPIGAKKVFMGNFDGNGVMIKNLFVGSSANAETADYSGLFGRVSGNVANINIVGCVFYTNSTYAGGLIGYSGKGDIANCSVAGKMTNIRNYSYVGGVLGYRTVTEGMISGCSSQVNITGNNSSYSYNGGLIGGAFGGDVKRCISQSTIIGSLDYNAGFASYVKNTKFENCQSNTEIQNGYTRIGGFSAVVENGEFSKCDVVSDLTDYYSGICVGGFAGYVSEKIKLTDCNVETSIVEKYSSFDAGGMIGNGNDIVAENCFVNITDEQNKYSYGRHGGFAGYVNGVLSCVDCCAVGTLKLGYGTTAGGFLGYVANTAQEVNCLAAVDISTGSNSTAGGFVGDFKVNNAYNCAASGDICTGDSSKTGGFYGYCWNGSSANSDTVSMDAQNCYASGNLTTGKDSSLAAFLTQRQYLHSTINYKKCYWNESAKQVYCGVERSLEEKQVTADDIAYTGFKPYQGAYMKTKNFADIMNSYVDLYQEGNAYTLQKWEQDKNLNKGYPYQEIFKNVLKKNYAISTTASPSPSATDSDSGSAGVFGRINFKAKPSPTPSEPVEPTTPPSPTPTEEKPDIINVDLEWGSMEYTYDSGDWNEENQKYDSGIWTPQNAGTSDIIDLTNKSSFGVDVNYVFLPNTSDENYEKLSGVFYQNQIEVNNAIYVPGKDGFEQVSLAINGEPTEEKNVTDPDLIGTVGIFISRNDSGSVTPETEEPVVTTLAPEDTDIPVPTTSEPENPDDSNRPEVSWVPEETIVPEITA